MLDIVLKRIRLSLRNGWIVTAWAVMILLSVAAVSLARIDFGERWDLYVASQRGHLIRAENANVYRRVAIGLERPPAALSLLSRGVGEELGSSATLRGRYAAPELGRRDRSTAVAGQGGQGALLAALAVILGFVSVFSVHGVINGERRRGTLKQVLARGIPRSRLLLAELAGGWLTLALPLVAIFLALACWIGAGGIAFAAGDWARFGLLLALLGLYSAVWVALSLTLSVYLRRPETSLLLGLLAWVLTSALYPSLIRWSTAEPPTASAQRVLARQAGPDEVALRRDAAHAQRNRQARAHARYRGLAALLPVTAFLDAAAIVATTSVGDHLHYLEQVDRAQGELEAWQAEMLERYPQRENAYVYPSPPLDLAGLPEPSYSPRRLGTSLRAAVMPVAAMATTAAVLLLLAMAGFERLDVR